MNKFPDRDLIKGRQIHGFTLLEIIIAVLIVGILASLLLPSLAHWKASYDLNIATESVAEAISYFQRESIRRNSKIDSNNSSEVIGCKASINSTSITSAQCPEGNYLLPKGITLTQNFSPPSPLVFSPLGTITQNGTINIYSNYRNDIIRCIRIGMPLGLIRQGVWVNGICARENS